MVPLMFVALFACALGQNTHMSTSQERQLLDTAFARYDHNPQDGVMMEVEWDATIAREDLDSNGCVTVQEYLQVHSCPVADQLFAHYDHDNDGCLKIADMSTEFHLIDKSGDNVVSLHEYEQYFLHLTNKLFPHMSG